MHCSYYNCVFVGHFGKEDRKRHEISDDYLHQRHMVRQSSEKNGTKPDYQSSHQPHAEQPVGLIGVRQTSEPQQLVVRHACGQHQISKSYSSCLFAHLRCFKMVDKRPTFLVVLVAILGSEKYQPVNYNTRQKLTNRTFRVHCARNVIAVGRKIT